MIVQLSLNENKVEEYNKKMEELQERYPNLKFKKVVELSDRFIPYNTFVKILKNSKYAAIQQDYRREYEFDAIYVCNLNENHTIEYITDYKEKMHNENSPLYYYDYGVADNASQVLDYYDSLYQQHKDYMNDRKFVILLHPIFKDDQYNNDSWKWSKWGRYIGKFKPEYEYLYDETGIDYLYCFNILEVIDS